MELHKDIAEFKVCQKLQDLEEKEKADVYQFRDSSQRLILHC